MVSQRELEQNLTNHNDLEVSGEDQELTEQLELAVEEAKEEEQELGEQQELTVEKVKAEEERVAEQLELVVEKVKAEEELTKQLPLSKEDELLENREVTCWTRWGGRSFSRCCEEKVTFYCYVSS